jgi:hypothetical protein
VSFPSAGDEKQAILAEREKTRWPDRIVIDGPGLGSGGIATGGEDGGEECAGQENVRCSPT